LDGRPTPTEANEPGPHVRPADRARLEREFARLARRSRLVILSGSLPSGCPADTYARLIRLAKKAGRPVLLDTSGPALRPATAAGPDLVKLNSEEAGGTDPRRLLKRGASQAVITLGGRGAIGLLGGRAIKVVPPRVRVATPVGAGDTFLAGLAHSILKGEEPERSLAYAAAVATASCRVVGAGVFRPKDAAAAMKRTRVTRLD
jgi:fructose-1-phosphate kinase PfkB-like protein